MKKVFALILALVMVIGMATTAFAATGDFVNTKGSITIDNAHVGINYDIYQILVLESFNTDASAFSYRANAAWKTWVEGAGSAYLTTLADGTVQWVPGADVVAFTNAALAYAKANSEIIKPVASRKETSTDETVKTIPITFSDLQLGYYLVDSSAGALCSIDSTIPDIHIEEKNPIPPVDKKVFDADGNPQESISAKIGQTVTFGTKITAYEGSHNYVYQDMMEAGLTYSGDEKVKVYFTPMSANNPVDEDYYEVVSTGLAENITFEVRFSNDFLATIEEATDLTIVYEAVLNENAVIYNENNTNTGRLQFGDGGKTKWDPADVYTYKFGIVKTDVTNNILTGAKFELYYDKGCTDQIKLVKADPTDYDVIEGVNYYRPATEEEIAAEDFKSAVIEAGKACIWGVRDHVAMYLKEIEAPVGYNKLAAPHHITALEKENNMPQFDAEGLYVSGGVEVENLTGTQLPQTGGIGTTLFYVFGGLMVAAAVVLLVTKKRMSA